MSRDNSYAKNLLAQRGRRAVATLLNWLESNVYQHLPEELQAETRSRVMAVMGEYQDLAMDMVAADTGIINDYWAEALTDIHTILRRIDGHYKVSSDR